VETVIGEIGKPDFVVLSDMGLGAAARPIPSAEATKAWNLTLSDR